MAFTVFYDGNCPLCVAEMDSLRKLDKAGALRLENIAAAGFSERYPTIDINAANRILHGMDEAGGMLYGLDVTVKAWRAVGKKRWLACLRWPIVRWFADKAYLFFARHRMRISALLMGSAVCSINKENCSLPKSTSKANCLRSAKEDAEF